MPRARTKKPSLNGYDPIQAHKLGQLVANFSTMRKQWLERGSSELDPRRDIDAECGYPHISTAVPAETYQQLYDREAIAARVVEVFPKESWQVQPLVYETEDPEVVTEFEQAWDTQGKYLYGELNFYRSEEGSPIWPPLATADTLSGIGRYGVLVMGMNDRDDKGNPAALRTSAHPQWSEQNPECPPPVPYDKGRRLLYLRALPEQLAKIARTDQRPNSPRFGQPLAYNIVFNDPRSVTPGSGGPMDMGSQEVHWTRVIHIADVGHTAGPNQVFAVPRMQQVLNRLLDLRKVYSADAEGWWQNAFALLFFSTHQQLGGDVDIDDEAMKDLYENMQNSLQRMATLKGMSPTSIAPTVNDPTPHVAACIEAICIKLGVPVRIFKGSERGELASSQDDAAWNDRLKQRQREYITPRIVCPFVNRLIWLGLLPIPENGYYCEWPDLTSQTLGEKVTAASGITTALAQYISGQVETLIPPMQFLTHVLPFTEEEASAMLEQDIELDEGEEATEPLAEEVAEETSAPEAAIAEPEEAEPESTQV